MGLRERKSALPCEFRVTQEMTVCFLVTVFRESYDGQ